MPSGDQDDTFASYILPNWPNIEYRQFRQTPNYGYGAQIRATPENSPYLTSAWMKENISDRGPLGQLYRVWGDGKQMVKGDKVDYFGFAGYTNEQLKEMGYFVWMPVQEKGSWLGEGDNHTFMKMLGNGLQAFENGTFGAYHPGKCQAGPGYPCDCLRYRWRKSGDNQLSKNHHTNQGTVNPVDLANSIASISVH